MVAVHERMHAQDARIEGSHSPRPVEIPVVSGSPSASACRLNDVDACIIGFREVTDLVVTYRGSIAWIVRKGAQCKTTTFEVHSAQVSGTPALLEGGPAIGPGSLRLSHQTVSWENAGQRRSAHLP